MASSKSARRVLSIQSPSEFPMHSVLRRVLDKFLGNESCKLRRQRVPTGTTTLYLSLKGFRQEAIDKLVTDLRNAYAGFRGTVIRSARGIQITFPSWALLSV